MDFCITLGYDACENGNSPFKITTFVKVLFIFLNMYFNYKQSCLIVASHKVSQSKNVLNIFFDF